MARVTKAQLRIIEAAVANPFGRVEVDTSAKKKMLARLETSGLGRCYALDLGWMAFEPNGAGRAALAARLASTKGRPA